MPVGKVQKEDRPCDQKGDSGLEIQWMRMCYMRSVRPSHYFFNTHKNNPPGIRALAIDAI